MSIEGSSDRGRCTSQTSMRQMLGWAALGSAVAALLVAVAVAPPDAVQGNAARLMYLHVPAAWTAYFGFLVVFVASVQLLRTRNVRWDHRAAVAAEIGVAMTALTIVVGSLWGRAVWGVWWAWDPRLVSTAMMMVVYSAYLALRQVGTDPDARARRAAWLGVGGALTIPVVHFSVVWSRSLHQPATLLAPNTRPPIDAVMTATLAIAVVAFTCGAAWLFLWRLDTSRGTARATTDPETVPAP